MRVPAAKMHVAHTFEVVRKAKVASIFFQRDIEPVCLCIFYFRSDPEPRTYLHLRGRVGVLLRLLVSPEALHLGSWGGCLQVAGLLPMTGSGAMWVEAGDGLAVLSPLGGRPVQDENTSSREPSAGS